jgi:pyridoxal 5'-phosphate synthase pdxT subunit
MRVKKIGVLALQGAFYKHREILEKIEVNSKEIRSGKDLKDCDGLIIPGGESTTISKFLQEKTFFEEIVGFAEHNPVMGTCAGAIIMSCNQKDPRIKTLNLIEMEIERNAYGAQIDSFETTIQINGIDGTKDFKAFLSERPK